MTFDYKNVIKKCVDFYDGGRCVSRSSMGNPKVSVFVLWGSREAGRDVGGVSEWAVRVDRCAGSSMHIGCMSRPYPKEKGHDEDEEWAMAGVVGEAYNMKYTAYLLGSQGMVWECTAKGPRSLTQQVMVLSTGTRVIYSRTDRTGSVHQGLAIARCVAAY